MTLEESVMIADGAKIQYFRTVVRGKALHHFDTFFAEVGSNTSETLTFIVLGLGIYFVSVNTLSKQNHVMR